MDFLNLSPDAPDGENTCSLPLSYVEDEALRVEIYRRIAGLPTREKAEALEQELADRFGRLPQSVRNLLRVAGIRIAASQLGVRELDVQKEKVFMKNSTGSYLQRRHKMPRLYQKKIQTV